MRAKAVTPTTLNRRYSGVLAHPTSFPGPYGIGDLGQSARDFITFLKKSKQTLWQILPLGPTGFGDSPYQAFSSYAGQPLIISPDLLCEEGYLSNEDLAAQPNWDPTHIDFGPVIEAKNKLLKKAYENYVSSGTPAQKQAIKAFQEQEEWLVDYALFMALKDKHEGKAWQRWESTYIHPTDELKAQWTNELEEETGYYVFLQYHFFKQWESLKTFANERDIEIIGDIPIFVSPDSADVWANQHLFQLEEDGYPTCVAGVPPDYFSATGQLWGNPLYKWEAHKDENYTWWINRIRHQLRLTDYLRIDHFRGFEAYWSVPYGEETAIHGQWVKGPDKSLFEAIQEAFDEELPIIAEDLGVITPEVEELRDTFHLPGMKVLQFAFDSVEENAFLPHHCIYNSVAYTGTHDNDTTLGWFENTNKESQEKCLQYLNSDGSNISWDFIRLCFSTVCKYAVVPLQDVLSYGSNARMNIPGTASGNWGWRYGDGVLTEDLSTKFANVTTLFGRGN